MILGPLHSTIIDMATKGFCVDSPTSASELLADLPGLFDGPFVFPLMTADLASIEHNIKVHAAFCESHGVRLAPHAKTTMAPALIEAQLSAGAWGITVATISQARVLRSFGVERILLANELVDPVGLDWVIAELESDSRFEFWCYIDSVRGVELIAEALLRNESSRPFTVLLEVGHEGGRTGVRDLDCAIAVGRAALAVEGLEVVGVSAYEGTATGETLADRISVVVELATRVRKVTETFWRNGVIRPDRPVLVSAGGSVFFDAIVEHLGGQWLSGAEIIMVLRSGAYITHDHGLYAETTGYRRLNSELALRPALKLWAQVLSRPEDHLVLLGFGRRDAATDAGMPLPLVIRREDGRIEDLEGCKVSALNDQHAYMQVDDSGTNMRPGDVIGLGISHPCTALDKWRVIPLVDDRLRVIDCINTYF